MNHPRRRRAVAGLVVLLIGAVLVLTAPDNYMSTPPGSDPQPSTVSRGTLDNFSTAEAALSYLEVKGRAPKTGYERAKFGVGWQRVAGCDMRNHILARDLTAVERDDQCRVVRGELADPYTGTKITFRRGAESSQAVQIDHVVALSDAWQKGAQQLTMLERIKLSNDPLNLLAVSGEANQQKADNDAASWLPPKRDYRCQFVARQVAVKVKYRLWVTAAERKAIQRVLSSCPGQQLPSRGAMGT